MREGTLLSLGEAKAALCVADVSGKGLPAALMMSNLHAALKSTTSEDVMPNELCAQLNRLMCANTPLNRFISGFYGLLDVPSRFDSRGEWPHMLIQDFADGQLASAQQIQLREFSQRFV